MHESVSIETISLQNTKSAMTVYSRDITYSDRIATITVSRQLQKMADNCNKLLFTYAKSLWFQTDPGRPRQIRRHIWMFQSYYYLLTCVQKKTKKTLNHNY